MLPSKLKKPIKYFGFFLIHESSKYNNLFLVNTIAPMSQITRFVRTLQMSASRACIFSTASNLPLLVYLDLLESYSWYAAPMHCSSLCVNDPTIFDNTMTKVGSVNIILLASQIYNAAHKANCFWFSFLIGMGNRHSLILG